MIVRIIIVIILINGIRIIIIISRIIIKIIRVIIRLRKAGPQLGRKNQRKRGGTLQPASAIVAGQLDERIIITAATNQLLSFRGAVSGVGSRGNCGQDILGDHSFTCAQGGLVAYAGLGGRAWTPWSNRKSD